MRPPGTHRRRPDRRTRRRDRASGEGARRTTRSGSGRRFRTSRARAGRGRPRARALRSPASSSSASNHRWRRWRRKQPLPGQREHTVAAALIGCLLWGPAAAAADVQSEKVAICPSALETRLVPLPIYATLPNEGGTFGVMPVFLRICDENQRTESIIAPSITWNDVIHLTGTL